MPVLLAPQGSSPDGADSSVLTRLRPCTPAPLTRRETEIKQLQGWKATVDNLADRFQELVRQRTMLNDSANPDDSSAGGGGGVISMDEETGEAGAAARGAALSSQHASQLQKLRTHFLKDVRKQLYTTEDDKNFFTRIKVGVGARSGLLCVRACTAAVLCFSQRRRVLTRCGRPPAG